MKRLLSVILGLFLISPIATAASRPLCLVALGASAPIKSIYNDAEAEATMAIVNQTLVGLRRIVSGWHGLGHSMLRWNEFRQLVAGLEMLDGYVAQVHRYRRRAGGAVNTFALLRELRASGPRTHPDLVAWEHLRSDIDDHLRRLRRGVIADRSLSAILAREALNSPDDYESLSIVDWILTDWSEWRANEPADYRFHTEIGGKQIGFGTTVSRATLALARRLNLTRRDIFLDVGAGFGRFDLLLASQTRARIVGVELIASRVDYANQSRAELPFKNVEFYAGDVLTDEFAELFNSATVYYLANSLSREDMKIFIAKVKPHARGKRIVTHVESMGFERQKSWLTLEHRDEANALWYFRGR